MTRSFNSNTGTFSAQPLLEFFIWWVWKDLHLLTLRNRVTAGRDSLTSPHTHELSFEYRLGTARPVYRAPFPAPPPVSFKKLTKFSR